MNLLISIGCDKYDSLSALTCAEADAKALYDILTTPGDPYSIDHAILLLSPTAERVRQVLEQTFPLKSGCDSVTFFFAGHGGMAGGSFFLCLSDCQSDKLSTTALSISSLFTIINDFKPAQVNLVIDACSAGGSSFDLGTLIKSEFTGASTSSSIAFLGACCVDQNASEKSGHGFLTAQLLRTLQGEVEVQRRGPFLDLLEIGTVVSSMVEATNDNQRPLSWGLSLFGGSRFAKNPFYSAQDASQHFPLPDISPYSHFGTKIRETSGELWEIHRELPKDFSPRRLLKCLAGLLSETTSAQERVALVKGIGASLASRAAESEDLMAPWLCMGTCIASLLPYADQPDVEAYLPELCLSLLDRDRPLQTYIDDFTRKDEHYLLSQYAVAGDLYYLPLRITQILGWIGLDILGLSSSLPCSYKGRSLPHVG
jgi:Caspase domain